MLRDKPVTRKAARSDGKIPFCIIANAGTINTGAVDPLPELADFCREEGLWLHVDGAYGAAAVLCDRGRSQLAGLEQVDSLALDPHKWLFQPYEIGSLLVRNQNWPSPQAGKSLYLRRWGLLLSVMFLKDFLCQKLML